MEPQKTEISGDRLGDIETFVRIKSILIDFLRGYPAWKYYGIFESYFNPEIAKEIIEQLKQDEIIKLWELDVKGKKVIGYSLTGKGAQLASSLRTHFGIVKLNKVIIRLTKILGILAGMTILVGLAQYILFYTQFPLF
ncbi:MAG: hypothetical protein WC812_02965 [Candidatus Pacearchaeota archaeon]|jgi:hypothetical protein